MESLRKVLPFEEGDKLHPPSESQADTWQRLSKALGAIRSTWSFVCCDSGKFIVYVGVQEAGAPALKLHDAPSGTIRLDEGIAKASADLYQTLQSAVRRGRTAEDDTTGSALSKDKDQSARFIEAAKAAGADETGKEFERAFKKVVPSRNGINVAKKKK